MRLTPNLHVGLVLGIATASVILALGGCVTGGAGQAHESAAPGAGSKPSAQTLEPFSESERERILAVQDIVAHAAAERERILAVQDIVAHAAAERGIDIDLLNAMIYVESRFDPDAKSPAGARGLMQLMPATAAYLAKQMGERNPRAYDPEFNVRAGSLYLAEMIEKFDDERYAVAAYHAGPGNVKRWLESGEAFPEYSDAYVAKVMDARARFEGSGAHGGATQLAVAPEPKSKSKSKHEPEPEPEEVPDISTLPSAAEIHGMPRVVYVQRKHHAEPYAEPQPPAPIEGAEAVFIVHREMDANPGAPSSWRMPAVEPAPQPRPRRESNKPRPAPAPEPKPASEPKPKPKPEPAPAIEEEAGLGVLPDL